MNYALVMIWSPAMSGAVLVAIVLLDMFLFKQQLIEPQQMLTNEVVAFCLVLVCCLVSLGFGAVSAIRRNWRYLGLAVLNTAVAVVCLFIAMYHGIALLHAT